MYFLKLGLFYTIWCLVPCVLLLPVTPVGVFYEALIIILIVQSALFFFLDKIYLWFIRGRNIKNLEQTAFYQHLEYVSYRRDVPRPDIFLFNGSLKKFFILKSGKSWIFVCEEELFQKICSYDFRPFVEELFELEKKNSFGVQAKLLGAICFNQLLFWMILEKVLLVKRNSKAFLMLNSLFTVVNYPFIQLLIWFFNTKVPVKLPIEISEEDDVLYSKSDYLKFMFEHFGNSEQIDDSFKEFLLSSILLRKAS